MEDEEADFIVQDEVSDDGEDGDELSAVRLLL